MQRYTIFRDFFLHTFRLIEKCAKDQADVFFSPTFPLMEKSAKDQADGKCNRTCPLPPTVGMTPARSVITLCSPKGLQSHVENDIAYPVRGYISIDGSIIPSRPRCGWRVHRSIEQCHRGRGAL